MIRALLVTLGLLAARALAAPALSDPVGGPLPDGLHLSAPWLYVLLAPLFTLWDGVSMLSASRLRGFVAGLAALYLLWRAGGGLRRGTSWRREALALASALLLFSAFIVFGAVWHRPMLALAGVPRNDVAVDYHSHTNLSRDVRNTLMRRFDLAANRRWHGRAGFDAVFVTDHNRVYRWDRLRDAAAPAVCPGVEISAWHAHVVLLGTTMPVRRGGYGRSLDGLLALLRTSDARYGALSVASLPEYERDQWERLERLVDAGLDGFEIVNASPVANELTRARRDSVIALAERRGRFVVGVSDSHGWGATSMVWNLVHAPPVCSAILERLRTGITGNRIIERHRLRPDDWWPGWLTPVGVVWETWRGMGWLLTASWLVWTWAPILYRRHASHPVPRYRFRRARPDRHQ